MNWKIILGVLIIFGSVSEFFHAVRENRGKPVTILLIAVIVVAMCWLGIYLIKKGHEKKGFK